MPVGESENQIKQGASRYLIFNQFDGMDTQASRVDLPIDKQAWLENLQPIARNKLQGVPAPAAAIYSLTGETVVRTFSGIIINGTEYIIAFCASGSAYAATVAFNGYGEPIIGATVVFIAPAGTFSPTGGDVVEWNAQRILIADSISGYSTWDGNLFVRQGNASPNIAVTNGGFGYTNGATATLTIVLTKFTVTAQGSLYANGATVAISGGSGTGMTAVALVIGGKVINIQQTSPGQGYLPGDTLTVVITPVSGGSGATATGSVAAAPGVQPTASVQVSNGIVTGLTLTGAGSGLVAQDGITVIITGNGGAGSGATAIARPWPFITPFPTTLAIAFGRVWLAAGRTLIVTGTGSITSGQGYDDFNLADASVTTTLQDSDLIQQITALRYLDNYLYIIGDNSVKSIGGITVTNGVTAFSIITLSSDQGTIWPNSCISFNRLILFANTTGVHAVFGASVEKISGPMDGIFQLADYTQPLQAAVVDLNSIHTYLLLIRYRDPLAPGERSLLLGYGDRKWFVMSQGNGLTSICTAIINSISIPFGSSGADLTQLLQNTSAGVPFKISTSLSSNGDPINGKRIIRAGLGQTSDQCTDIVLYEESAELGQVKTNFVSGFRPATWVNNAGQVITWVNNSGQIITWASFGFTANKDGTTSWNGRWIGLTATGTINGIQIPILWIEYQPDAPQSSSGITPCTPGLPAPPPIITPITPPVPPTPPTPPVTATLLFVNGASCHYSAWKLTDTGNQPPRVIVEGAQIDNTTLFDTDPTDSFSSQLVVGASGKQYIFDSTFPSPGSQLNQIVIFAKGVNGNVPPLGSISGGSTGINNLTGYSYFIAVDASENIYVLSSKQDASNTTLLKWPAGTTGNVAPTTLFSGKTYLAVDFEYDTLNNQLWVLDQTNNAARAYTLAGSAGHVISGGSTLLTGVLCMNVGGDGRIYVVDNNSGTPRICIFANGTNGNVAPTSNITGAATGMKQPNGIAVDPSNNMYLSDFNGTASPQSAKSYILVYPSGSSGNTAPTQKIIGDYTGLTSMVVGANTFAAGVEIGVGVLPGAPSYTPPATHFNSSAELTSNVFTPPATSRYGLISVWSYNYNAGNATLFTTSAGNIGVTLSSTGSDLPGGEHLNLTLFDHSNAQILTTFPGFVVPGWRHDLISWDTQTQKVVWLVNGGNTSTYLASNTVWSSSNPVGYAGGTWEVGDATNSMDIAELWFATPASFFDLTVPANLAKFVVGDGVVSHAVNLGASGTNPGITPLLYLTGGGSAFANNQGTGGAFTLASGALSPASTAPGSSPG